MAEYLRPRLLYLLRVRTRKVILMQPFLTHYLIPFCLTKIQMQSPRRPILLVLLLHNTGYTRLRRLHRVHCLTLKRTGHRVAYRGPGRLEGKTLRLVELGPLSFHVNVS